MNVLKWKKQATVRQSPLLLCLCSLASVCVNQYLTQVFISNVPCVLILKLTLSLNYNLSVQYMLQSLKVETSLKVASRSWSWGPSFGPKLNKVKARVWWNRKRKLQDPLSMSLLSWSDRRAAQSVSACCLALIILLFLTYQQQTSKSEP